MAGAVGGGSGAPGRASASRRVGDLEEEAAIERLQHMAAPIAACGGQGQQGRRNNEGIKRGTKYDENGEKCGRDNPTPTSSPH
jgi:hypothetical protein